MIHAEHGVPAADLVAVARLFRFRDNGGYGNSTPLGYLAVKPALVAVEGGEPRTAWFLSLDGKRLAEMEPILLANGAPTLVGSFGLCYYVLMANPPIPGSRGPQASLYITQVPPV